MTTWDWMVWLPAALLLLQVPGCSFLRGPNSVSGTVGGSLSVRCQYKEEFRDHDKYWCKSPCVWKKIVETTESQREVTKGRVSIRDHPADLTFTVTLKNLTEGDAGTYKCGIDTPWLDPTFSVVVSVTPGSRMTLHLKVSTWPGCTPGGWIKGRAKSQSGLGIAVGGCQSQDICPGGLSDRNSETPVLGGPPAPQFFLRSFQHPHGAPQPHRRPPTAGNVLGPVEDQASDGGERSLLSRIYFLLLIFLEVPLLLDFLSAVLWVNRPQKGSGVRRRPPDNENQ